MNWIMVDQAELDDTQEVWLSGVRAEHIYSVLRLSVGDQLRVTCVNGPRGEGTIREWREDRVRVACVWGEVPLRPSLNLLLAMPRPKVLRRLWAQIAALGVDHIHLLGADRVERYYFDSHIVQPDVYKPLLLEGLAQSGGSWMPNVKVHPRFDSFFKEVFPTVYSDHLKWVADPREKATFIDQLSEINDEREWLLAVGPEGGWSTSELELFTDHGFLSVGLGSRILRSDTTTISLIGMARSIVESTRLWRKEDENG